jgi:hypothetical protein
MYLISNFCRVLNVVCFLLGNSLASKFYMPTFWNTLSHLHRQVGMKDNKVEKYESIYTGERFGSNQTFLRINTPTFLNLVILRTYLHMEMKQTECSETSAYKIQTPGNYPEKKHTTGEYLLLCLHPRIPWILIQSQVNSSYTLTLLFI